MSTPTEPIAAFPDMDYESWRGTLQTIHRFAQVVGKVRLAASPRHNHWWNVPLRLTGRGLTSRPMGRDPIFCIDFDFLDHRLDLTTTAGQRYSFSLPGLSVAAFYERLQHGLATLGVRAQIDRPYPFDLPDADRPFSADTEHASYDTAAVTRYWQVLSQVNLLLEAFASGFSGKTSPVQHFWHTFDIAMTRFADKHVEQSAGADSVTREAYSREVISFGFWFGDENFREPAFYSYTAPEPDGLASEPLAPPSAGWVEQRGSHLAILHYRDLQEMPDPHQAVLDFYESAYQAGARLAGWDIARYASPDGVTDPRASSAD
ncbi:MAG: DUF5996 family protein [Truepera sp.]|nr:DUF5996 family protein [Truepera sp.]